jgi:hypothetical protein
MTNPTSNFGWQMPTSTDLVTDLPADFEVFGQAVDTSMADLKGGTTGQILSKASNTNMDFTWITNDVGDITEVTAGTGISGGGTSGAVTITNSMATAIDAKGDLVAGTGADAFSRLAVGANDTVLTADSTAATGLKWATPSAGGGMTLINTGGTALSGTSTQVSSIPGTYKSLEIWVVNAQINADTEVGFTINNDTGATQYLHYRLFNQDTTPGSGSQKTSSVLLSAVGASYFVKNSTENMTKIVIPNYSATGIKQFKVDFVGKQGGSAYTYMLNGLVYTYNTSAVTSFELRAITTGSFSGGTIYVYGVN